jgi:hypothetical protein
MKIRLPDLFDGLTSASEYVVRLPCNAHLRDLAKKVKFGILREWRVPVEVPVLSPESAFRLHSDDTCNPAATE